MMPVMQTIEIIPSWVWVQNALLPVLGMGMGAFALFGLYRTVNRHLDRRHEARLAEAGGAPPGEIEELRLRVEVLEEQALRVQELEERVDFAERILARHDERRAIADGS
ncbi:MAG TPA: hypothetical protein VGA37_09510 [Gemmatimonadales bacterium]